MDLGDALGRLVPILLLLGMAPLVVRRMRRTSRSGGLEVEQRASLAKGSGVAIVVVGERRMLVGVGAQGISLLAELDRREASTGVGGLDDTGMIRGPRIGLADELRRMTRRTHVPSRTRSARAVIR